MREIEPTNKDILYNAREIALKKGIKNVYLGNMG